MILIKPSLRAAFCLFFFCTFLLAQNVVEELVPPPHIKTIKLKGKGDFTGTSVFKLGEPIILTFDDINGNEEDYYYKISYYNFDWTPSQLYKNEFLDGMDGIRIFNYENSFNAYQLYSHYRLRIPNDDTNGLKVSGNYLLEIYNDSDDLIFSRKFILYEDITTIGVAIKRSRDLNFIDTKQVVQFEINSPTEILRNPNRTVRTLVIQNNNLKTAITDLVPQFTIGTSLVYKYDQEASFWGGNEYLFFDNKEVRTATANIQRIDLQEIYHNYLFTDIMRANRPYTYNPDVNGSFVVRNLRADDSNTQADYVQMHFSLECFAPIGDGELHVFGNFNNFILDDTTRLTFNKETALYQTSILFKQGFYNYTYVLLKPDGTLEPGFVSGNFDETENDYMVVAYYRAPTARYDRAIGRGMGNSRNIRN
ncbi:DUF5103 domain-containing protein [Aquimarina sp. ERC-38]|uniref:type IX secretion system plug protein n=1 Tax=Aquimarina sp. ERC-38 TaxID=2949996 RepID=UPI002246EBF7|nr:DUF5103 domain-containing protein [Aquimarina sp. ERC-38]UZO82565.1 DUF5103 domain-containing protein [Aquimarina sp. ERC-38]